MVLLLYQILSLLFWKVSSTLFLYFNVIYKLKVKEKEKIILFFIQGKSETFFFSQMIWVLIPQVIFLGT